MNMPKEVTTTTELRNMLKEQMDKLDIDTATPQQVAVLGSKANAVGKIISLIKIDLTHCHQRGEKPDFDIVKVKTLPKDN